MPEQGGELVGMRSTNRVRRHDLGERFQALIPLLPTPWSADEFVRRVAADRNRSILLLTYPLSTEDPTGFWLSTSAVDYIVVPVNASGGRRDAIICHELAHIVLGHDARPAPDDAGLTALAPNSPPGLVARFLPRAGYDAAIEREAENLATRLIAYVQARSAGTATGTELDRLTTRLR